MPDRGLIGKMIGKFRVGRMLGQGGMGAVYEATDVGLQRQVALKVMHSHLATQTAFQQRFLQEARTAARLDHPNIVRVLSFDKLDNELILVMELATGGNLRQHIKRLRDSGQYIDYPEAIEITIQLADSLAYAHDRNMVHMDVKPDNVVLKPEQSRTSVLNYRPILTDFGLAHLTTSGEAAITDQPIGTYAYMSPEQCNAERVDARTDIYSLGIMLFELTVGQLPFNPKTIAEAARMHGQDPLPSPTALRRGFSPELEQIIFKSLHKRPEKRYQTIEDLIEDLQALQSPDQQESTRASKDDGRSSSSSRGVAVVVPQQPDEPDNPDEFSTDLVTLRRLGPISEEMPEIDPPEWTDQQKLHDRLVFYDADQVVHVASLTDATMTIGRAWGQDIRLEGRSISREHGRIERKPNGTYYLHDVGSTNGTWVQREKLTLNSPVIWRPEQTVRMGGNWARLELALEPQTSDNAGAVADETTEDIDFATDVGAGEGAVEAGTDIRDTDALRAVRAEASRDIDSLIAKIEVEANDGNTDYMGVPLPLRVPYYTPPPLTSEQMQYGRLLFYSEAYQLVVVAMTKDEIDIGRADDVDAKLEGFNISYRHARVVKKPDGVYIYDLGATNGVWVEADKIEPHVATPIDPSSIIRMGDYWMKYDPARDMIVAGMDDEMSVEQQRTVAMVRPLPEEVPPFSTPPLSAEQRSRDRLIFYSEDHPVQFVQLDEEVMTIGRLPDQDVILQGKRVSRNHARIEIQKDGIYVTNLDATNGIWIDDIALVPHTAVLWHPHETMRLGNYWVKFERGTHQYDIFSGAQYQQDERGLIGKALQKYRIDRFLGQGPVAAVYKATDIELDRDVALRILNPNLAAEEAMRQRFLREARSLSRLDHPSIVRVLSFDNADGEIFMVMDLIQGGSMRQYLTQLSDQNREMDYGDAIQMGIQMSDGLHYAHQQGMVHRSIRPENIVLRPEETIGPLVRYRPILTDFGMAGLTESGEIFMTDKPDLSFPYLSPEEVLSNRIDNRSDIYEMGVILYEMTIGKPPFQPQSIAEATRMHAHEKPRKPSEMRPGYPDELENVVLKALEKDPNNRYQSADELSRALQRATRTINFEGSMSSFARYFSVREDEHVTQPIPEGTPPPAEMPPATRYPRLDVDSVYDRLVVYSENVRTQVISLNKDLFTIGREEDQDIVLDNKQVSRRHARIERASNETYRIIHVGGTNRTWLGDYELIPNIAEMWEAHETVRIGEYWLRLEFARDADDVTATKEEVEESEEVVPVVPEIKLPPPEHDKIGLDIHEAIIRVAPGSSMTMPIEITNKANKVDHFRVELNGLPPDWFTQPIEPLYLLPNNRETTSITFHPPLTSSSSAGAHAFEVRVFTRAQGINSVARQGSLIIEPYRNFQTKMDPERIRRHGLTEVRISNTGNTHGSYLVEARDKEQALRYEQAGKQYILPPGQSDYAPIRVSPRRRPFFGRAQTIPFEVTVTTDNETLPPQTSLGELIVYPRFSIWTILGILMLFLCCGLIAGVGFFRWSDQNRSATQVAEADTEVANTAVANQAVLDVTATAGADSDGDGLSDAREEELGTSPDNPDTDEDGISDGEEVLVWQSDPLRRDTDNDNLADGTEVAMGINPLNEDTDSDDIPDNVDEFPGMQPTPTITPFPTIPGSDGDICPGSPIPSRLAVGMTAFITEEGVSNNLRDAPGLDAEIIGSLPNGTEIRIISGPECDETDQIRWWEVETTDGQMGWTAEGEGDEYYIRPPGEEDEGEAGSANITVSNLALPEADSLECAMMGVQVQNNVGANELLVMLDHVNTMNLGWVKIQANWSFLEPDNAGNFGQNFTGFQTTIREAKARGQNVLISVAKAPTWARSVQDLDGPPDNPADLANFIRIVLETVGTNIDAIEIWNEPNLQREWSGTLPFTGGGYMQLFLPAYETIRAFSDDIMIVTAGLAPAGDSDASVNDRDFLVQMYNAGLGDFNDVMLGVHPFSWGNPPDSECCDPNPDQNWDEAPQFFFINNLEDYYGTAQNFDHRTTLWVTEFGWASWEDLPGNPPEPWMVYVSLEQQATYVVQAFQIAQALDFVGPMFLWNLNFADAGALASQNEMAGFSVIVASNQGGTYNRPVYDTLAGRSGC